MKKTFLLILALISLCATVRANTRDEVESLYYQLEETYYSYQDASDADPSNQILLGLATEYQINAGRVAYILTLAISDGTLIIDLAEINDHVWANYLTHFTLGQSGSGFNSGAANADFAAHTVIEQVVYHNI